MWGLPRSGIEPVSPALVGGFFATEPPGKPGMGAYDIFFPHEPYDLHGLTEA